MKRSRLRYILVTLIMTVVLVVPHKSTAEPLREFLMSCTYGVLAGSLVGAATLAFREQPGEHLKSIAVGASLGLYAGILLGSYIVYFVPGEGEVVDPEIPVEEEEPSPDALPDQEDVYNDEEAHHFRPTIGPLFTQSGTIQGVQMQVQLYTF